jgi:hypothetical protein
MLPLILFSSASTIVKTRIMANMPMVIPNKLKKERSLFPTNDCQAKMRLSFKRIKNILGLPLKITILKQQLFVFGMSGA